MKEVVFTAETRPARLAVVRRLTEHYERLNGVCPRILTPDDLDFASLPHPAWVKAYVWDLVGPDVERVTWIDSDTVCLRPMPPWPDAPFAAADDIADLNQALSPNESFVSLESVRFVSWKSSLARRLSCGRYLSCTNPTNPPIRNNV